MAALEYIYAYPLTYVTSILETTFYAITFVAFAEYIKV